MSNAYPAQQNKESQSSMLLPAVVVGGAALLLASRMGVGRVVQLGLLGGAVYLAYRQGRPMLAKATSGQGIRVEKSVSIMKPAEEVYRFWRQLENLPRFMKHLESVTQLDDQRSHWIAKAPAGTSVEWDAEITEDVPNERIAWRSLPGSQVPNYGSVTFKDYGPDRGTMVTVNLVYEPPAGPIGAAIARLFGEEPQQQIDSDLKRLRSMLEAGETPTTQGQPVGKGQPFSEGGRKTTQGY